MANYSQAVAYYRNGRITPEELKKIQAFLKYSTNGANVPAYKRREYYTGDVDGVFGPETFRAIQEYQRANGLVDDGMWGVRTNAIAMPVAKTWGAHSDNKQNVATEGSYRPVKASDYQLVIDRAISSDEENARFWSPENARLRSQIPQEILETIYDYTPDNIKQTIDYKALPTRKRHMLMDDSVRKRDEVAPAIAGVLTAPLVAGSLLAAPITTLAGAAGAYLGGRAGGNAGEQIGRDLVNESDYKLNKSENGQGYAETQYGEFGSPMSVVYPDASSVIERDKAKAGETGRGIGTAIGTVAGGAIGGYVGNKFQTGQWGYQRPTYGSAIRTNTSAPRLTFRTQTGNYGVDPSTGRGYTFGYRVPYSEEMLSSVEYGHGNPSYSPYLDAVVNGYKNGGIIKPLF